MSKKYTIEHYEKFNNEKGEILSLNKKDNNCEDIQEGDTLILDVGRYRAVEVEHFKAFNGGKGQNVLVLIKLITINTKEEITMKYITKQVVINDTEIDFPIYQNNISDTDNFTYIINHVIKIINIQKLILHTIRISENIPHLLYNKNNTYDASGTYRFGNINGPIISEIKLTNVVYLYDKNDIVIGKIKLIELNDNIDYITSYKTI